MKCFSAFMTGLCLMAVCGYIAEALAGKTSWNWVALQSAFCLYFATSWLGAA